MQEGTFKVLTDFRGLPTDEDIYYTDHIWTEDDFLIASTK